MLRAINDVNLAKFLVFDLPLFKGITQDLFPGTHLPEIDYKNMYECIDIEIERLGLQKVPAFIEKVIQLYELLYGMFDDVSHEWYDGILAVKFR